MKILVTGKNGQLASELRLQGQQTAHEVLTLGRDSLDIRKPDQVRQRIDETKPELVINAAAYTAVDRAEEDSNEAYAINRDGPRYLAESCKSQGIPLIHISTDYVFDGSKDSPYLESDEVSPLGVYGQSKWEGEQAVRIGVDKHIILRTSWVFSQYGHNFVKTIARVAAEHDELKVVNDQLGGPTSAKGIADAIFSLCNLIEQQAEIQWGTYHFSGMPFTSWHGFAQTIIDLGRKHGLLDQEVKVHPIPTSEYPTPAKRPANSRLSSDLFEKTFGIPANDWNGHLNTIVKQMASDAGYQ